MLQHCDVLPHQDSSVTCSTHNFHQQLSCHTVPAPSQEGRCTCAVSTASHSHLLQGFSITATSHKGFPPPQEGALHPAVATLGMWLFGFCLIHTHQLHLTLVSTPHAAPATPPMPHCSTQSSATHRDPELWKAKATHP